MFGSHHGFRVCTGANYLGGYIGDNESKHNWQRERTLKWEEEISTTRKTVEKYPQESYAAVVHAIQSEWIFLQRVTWDIGDAFRRSGENDQGKCFDSSFLWKHKKPSHPL